MGPRDVASYGSVRTGHATVRKPTCGAGGCGAAAGRTSSAAQVSTPAQPVTPVEL